MVPIYSDYPKLEQQREGLLQPLSGLRELRRGSFTYEQFLTAKHPGGSLDKAAPYPTQRRGASSGDPADD